MNARLHRVLGLSLILVSTVASRAATPQLGDVAPAAKRRPVVELAQRLATVTPPAPLAASVVLPFNPIAFSQPDPEEQRAIEQAQANQQAIAAGPVGPTRPAAVATDREQLAAIAAQLKPTGTFFRGSEPLLVISGKFYKIGTKFTVAFGGSDYVLELSAIDRTSFTLRLNGEAITRPIKNVKTSP
jgi:hypothetical protein